MIESDQVDVCARVEPPRDEAVGGEGVRPAGDLGHRGQACRVLTPVLDGKSATKTLMDGKSATKTI